MTATSGLTQKQLDSVAAATGLVNIWEGAVSSGKTVGSIYRFLMFHLATRDLPGEVVVVGRTRDSAWRNVLLPAMDLYPNTVQGNLGSPVARIFGDRVHVMGAADAKAENVIRGLTCRAIYVDEITTLPEAFFKMALTRLRVTGRKGGIASKMFGSTNPDNPLHWLKRDYLDRIGGPSESDQEITRTWRRFHFKLTDNPRLSPEYVTNMMAQYTGLFYKRFIDGLWVQGEGTIWDIWDEDRHVVQDPPRPERLFGVGVDFGSNHQSAGILLGVRDGVLYALEEWAPAKTESGTLSPSVQSDSFRRWLEMVQVQYGHKVEAVFVDSAALAFRDQLFVDGLATAPAWKDVLPGIQVVHSLFSLDRLKVASKCVSLRKEIPGYVWDAKAVKRGQDAPVKEKDDFCDALRYAVYSTRPQWRGQVPLLFPGTMSEVDKEDHDQLPE